MGPNSNNEVMISPQEIINGNASVNLPTNEQTVKSTPSVKPSELTVKDVPTVKSNQSIFQNSTGGLIRDLTNNNKGKIITYKSSQGQRVAQFLGINNKTGARILKVKKNGTFPDNPTFIKKYNTMLNKPFEFSKKGK